MRLLPAFLLGLFLLACRPCQASAGSPVFDQALGYFNAGQYGLAAEGFGRELQVTPQDALTHYYFGVSLHCVGRYPEATREYNWVLLNCQDSELIRRVQLGLQALARLQSAAPPPSQQYPQSAVPPLPPAPPAVGVSPAPTATKPEPEPAPTAAKTLPSAPLIGASGQLRIVDCYTKWCGWCEKFEPLFKRAQAKYKGRITFERVDAGETVNEKFVGTYHVVAYPTLLFFSPDGKLVKRVDGAPQTFKDFDSLIGGAFPGLH